MPQKFFITHSWEDIDFVRKLYQDLRDAGLDGFFDERSVRPSESIPSRIEQGLENCDVYIPVFSPDALKSKWCGWEIDMAITMNREGGRPHIIPVIAEKCNVPSRLRHLLHVNFVRRYDVALNELLTNGFGISKVGMVQVRLTLSRDRRLAELDIRARKPRFDAQSDSSMPFVVEKFPNHCKKCQSNFSGF